MELAQVQYNFREALMLFILINAAVINRNVKVMDQIIATGFSDKTEEKTS